MSDFESRLQDTVQTLADDAPTGDHLWAAIDTRLDTETRRRWFTKTTGVGLAIAAAIIAAIVTVNAVSSGPAKHRVRVTTPSSSSSVPTSTAPTTSTIPAKPTSPLTGPVTVPGALPAGDVVETKLDNSVVVAGSDLVTVKRVLEPATQTANYGLVALTNDRAHVFLAPGLHNGTCADLQEIDLHTGATATVFRQASGYSVSPDGSRVAVTWWGECAAPAHQQSGKLIVHDVATGTDRALVQGVAPFNTPDTGYTVTAWSPDGRFLAVSTISPRQVEVYDTSGTAYPAIARPASSQTTVAWTSDGLLLVDAASDGGAVVRSYDPKTGQPTRVIAQLPRISYGGGPLLSPHVDWMREIGGRTYVGLSAGAGSYSYAQIRVLDGSRNPVVINQWDGDIIG